MDYTYLDAKSEAILHGFAPIGTIGYRFSYPGRDPAVFADVTWVDGTSRGNWQVQLFDAKQDVYARAKPPQAEGPRLTLADAQIVAARHQFHCLDASQWDLGLVGWHGAAFSRVVVGPLGQRFPAVVHWSGRLTGQEWERALLEAKLLQDAKERAGGTG